mmetsp:Transcript_11575/g.12727  ORF Transcript_11575/g.12727 Transcript_11575/m.12727 type:complete len:148 (+) Transcript_11575:137-580(+)|eukprot:CAMPEP_0115004226 /NCGR_PEP_ID=MMETSP0216-20121206/19071_1 /TAXON_ID=223996 /ORGANISM="Protocruzia adherens, Strain Boccale" /LENGTH=147 /DNA_ID=CAMNT_0002370163 /DNA_START=96 /DNA_END=539 /DNA_ORIENTATION=-
MGDLIREMLDMMWQIQHNFSRLGDYAPADLNDIMYYVNLFEPTFRRFKDFPGVDTLANQYKDDLEEMKKNVEILHQVLKNFPLTLLKCMPCLKGKVGGLKKLEEVKEKFEKFKPIAQAIEAAMGIGGAIADVADSAKGALKAVGKLF